MADEYDYDLFTIGAGSGGVRASRVSAWLAAAGASRHPVGYLNQPRPPRRHPRRGGVHVRPRSRDSETAGGER